MNKRIDYIDSVKGFAILLMVMGHVLAWFWADWQTALSEDTRVMLLWRIIYSFHMPLFIFCSGLFIPKNSEWYNAKNMAMALYKRVKTLILPFIFMGGVHYLATSEILAHWYLWTLFCFSTFTLIVEYVVTKVGGGQIP